MPPIFDIMIIPEWISVVYRQNRPWVILTHLSHVSSCGVSKSMRVLSCTAPT